MTLGINLSNTWPLISPPLVLIIEEIELLIDNEGIMMLNPKINKLNSPIKNFWLKNFNNNKKTITKDK